MVEILHVVQLVAVAEEVEVGVEEKKDADEGLRVEK